MLRKSGCCVVCTSSAVGNSLREAYSIGRLIGAGLMPRRLALDCLICSGTMMSNAPGRRPWRAREVQQKVVRAAREGEHRPREVPA